MVRVQPRPHESIDKVLRRFKRLCEKEGIIRDYKKHECYESPSEKRRRKKSLSRRRQQKEQMQQELGQVIQ